MQALFLLPASPPPGLSVTGGRAELSRIAQFPRPVCPGAARLRTTLCAVLLTLVWAAPAHAQSAAPEITSETTFTVDEGTTVVTTLTATDADADSLTWSIPTDGGDDAALFTLSNTGGLTFTTAPDYENPADADGDNVYAVTVQVSDGTNTDMATLEVTVENVIELATEMTGPVAVSYAENRATRVATYTASSEADRAGLTWHLSGADAEHFSIDTPPGVLRFHIDPDADNPFPKLPDYEAPDDEDAKNDYEVIVLAQASSAFTSLLRVIVTVTDENEAGAISLSPARPKAAAELRAALTDPDGVTAGTVTWQWERSAGRNAWKVIAGATAAGYTPTAADTGAYLRATAAYTDSHPAGQTAHAVSAEVVTAHTLSRLEVTTSSSRSMYPAFDPEILHYAVGCQDTLTLTLSTRETDTRLAVNGIQRANRNVAVELTGLGGGSDIPITLTGSEGASTTYVLHCLADDFPAIITEKKPGAWDGLITIGVRAPVGSYLAIIDNNGVPRIHWRIEERVRIFRTHRDGRYPYSYGQAYSRNVIVLDENMEPVDKVTTVRPIQHTDLHDFVIKSNGNYLLLAYESARRDLSQFINSDNGEPYSTTELTRDSVIQEVTPDKEEAFNWNSWDHMAVEDCTQHRFPDDYAHVNSVQAFDDDIVASFRGCSKVLRIDGVSGDVMWRLGKSNRSDADWTASGTQPPLRIVGDPYGEFCGQHSARMIDNGNLLLFDNGVACLVDPEGNRTRPGEDFTRIVEYAIDPDHGEAIFQRHYSYYGEFNKLARSQGHIEPLETGNWLISWGSMPVSEKVTEFNPLTGEEVLIIKLHELGDSDSGLRTTAYPVEFVALADAPGPLTAEIVTRAATSAFHTGSGTAQVVVAFSRPVKDFEKDTLPIQVTGATVTKVEPHIAVDAAANAYLVTLEPEGDGDISFALVTGRSCADGGICTADGTSLSGVPETAHTIPGPVQVSFDEAAYTVTEGRTVEVVVELDRTHDRPGTLEIPLSVTGGSATKDQDYTLRLPVTFAADETVKRVPVVTHADDIIEAAETVELAFEDLPSGVKQGPTTTTHVTITDQTDPANWELRLDPHEVGEGGPATIAVAITNTVTFAAAQPITLTFSGDAEQGTDYTVGSDTLTLAAGQPVVTTTLRVVDDSEEEGDETITVTAQHDSTPIGTQQSLTISANDAPAPLPTISISAGPSVPEGDAAVFTLNRTTPQTEALAVDVTVSVSGDLLPVASPSPSTVTFAEGAGSASLSVRTTEDTLVEPDLTSVVTAEVTASSTNAYAVASGARSAAVTVEDDDEAKFTVIVLDDTIVVDDTIIEGDMVQVIVITRDRVTFASNQTLTLAFSGNAEQGTDYTVESDTLTLPAGQSDVTTLLHVLDDGAKELEETIGIAVQHDGTQSESQLLRIAASEDTEPPTFDHAEVPPDGRSLILTFSEPLAEAAHHQPAATAFTVTVAGEPHAVTTVTVSGAHVVLGLTRPVHPGQEVTVGYTMPAGRPAPPVLQDPAGHAVVSFSDEAVENHSQFGRRPPGRPPGGGPPGGGGPVCAEDVHGNTAAQATGIALATETAGAICPAADVDYFTLTAPGRGLVFVETTGSVNLRGTLWQNEEVLVTGPTGRGQGTRLGAPVQAGAVVVAVAGQGGATGEYEIVVTFSPGYLENPGHNSFQSGIGVISGWVCEAELVEIEIETERGETERYEAGYGTARADTAALPDGTPLCGDTDNGFGLLFNWNLLGAGEHEVVAYVDGMELDRATVTVTTVGEGEEEEFLRDVAGTCVVEDFPTAGETVTSAWQETKQNFVITSGLRPAGENMAGVAGEGYLENPGPNSFQSGIGVISGWVCEAETVEIVFETAQGAVLRYEAAYGTERADTAMQRKDGTPLCGDTDNGFGLLFNWNLLGDGEHTVVALVDEEELGRAVVRVTTVGTGDEEEFLRGAEGECVVADFPMPGETVTLEWQQNSQNFVITDVQ